MEQLIEQLSTPWGQRAILASSMVGISCGILGVFIVLRNMSLIGDALAHSILPGVFVSFLIVGYNTIGFFIGSVIAGVATSFGITWIQQKVPTKNDAAIGIIFSCMFAIGIVGISYVSSKGVHLALSDFLFGQILGVSNLDLLLIGIVMLLVVLLVFIFYRYLLLTTFQETIAKTMGINIKMVHYLLMFLLSFTVVSALKSVGVILVVSMLITPAAAALLIADRLKYVLIISAVLGLLVANVGMIFSMLFDMPPGPAMAITATLIYFLCVFFSPKKGLVFKKIYALREERLIVREDILKYAIKHDGERAISLEDVAQKLELRKSFVRNQIDLLVKKQLVAKEQGVYSLSEAGVHRANQLVRAHRLWESYLVNEMGMKEDEIHDDAELQEHKLTPNVLDQVDASLGYPETDPHGSPIPGKQFIKLSNGALNKEYMFVKQQEGDHIDAYLWEMGLLPNIQFKIVKKSSRSVDILYQRKKYRIENPQATHILIR